jgi:hypothetical protein
MPGINALKWQDKVHVAIERGKGEQFIPVSMDEFVELFNSPPQGVQIVKVDKIVDLAITNVVALIPQSSQLEYAGFYITKVVVPDDTAENISLGNASDDPDGILLTPPVGFAVGATLAQLTNPVTATINSILLTRDYEMQIIPQVGGTWTDVGFLSGKVHVVLQYKTALQLTS